MQELLRASQCAASAAPMLLLAFGRRGLGLTHRVDADSDSREYIPTADSPSCSPFYCFPNPPVPLSLTYHGATRTPPAAPRCTRGTPLARRTSWHRHSSRTSHLMASRQSARTARNLAPGVVDFRSSLRSSRARSGRVGHHVGFVSRPSQPWILHRRENIRETRELQIAASRVPA